jgi:hypothetical protein
MCFLFAQRRQEKETPSSIGRLGQWATLETPGLCRPEDCTLSPTNSIRLAVCSFLKPAEQDQDQDDYEYEAESAAAIVAGPVEGAAPEPAKAPE